MPQQLINLLTIESSHVKAMCGDARFVQAFPCVKQVSNQLHQRTTKSCNTCARGRKTQPDQAGLIRSVMECLIGLSDGKKLELKRLVGAAQVRVSLTNGRGALVHHTF